MSALDDVIHYHADNCQSGSECDLSVRATVAEQARNWYPIGFARDPLASRGWGTLIEAISGNVITFEELVSRYNALLFAAPQAEQEQTA